MSLEYHILKGSNHSVDLCLHDQTILFNTDTNEYKFQINNEGPFYTESVEEMRKNNYIEVIHTLDEHYYYEKCKQIYNFEESYNFCYLNPQYSYFVYNICNIRAHKDLNF